jgi:hypothetical protein
MEVLYNVWLIFALIAFIFCLCAFMIWVFIMFRKNELPDIEDVEVRNSH